jgi:hypothetical protein
LLPLQLPLLLPLQLPLLLLLQLPLLLLLQLPLLLYRISGCHPRRGSAVAVAFAFVLRCHPERSEGPLYFFASPKLTRPPLAVFPHQISLLWHHHTNS